MNKVYACIDGRANTSAVVDAATWAARRLSCPLVLAHVVEPQPGLATGFDANAPKLPRPRMAVPLEITATKLPFAV